MQKKILLSAIAIFGFAIISMAQVPSYIPTDSLIAWWPFTGNAIDSSGNGNNGTVNGATLTTDRFGNLNSAYYFSSSGCATRIDATVNTSRIQSGLTISVWVSKIGNGCIGPRIFEFIPPITNDAGSAQWNWDNTNSCSFGSALRVGSSSILVSQATFSPKNNNIWTHLVYTYV